MTVQRPTPPASSYWVGASREELNARMKERRAQQRSATVKDVTYDPAMAATIALMRDHKWSNAASRN